MWGVLRILPIYDWLKQVGRKFSATLALELIELVIYSRERFESLELSILSPLLIIEEGLVRIWGKGERDYGFFDQSNILSKISPCSEPAYFIFVYSIA